MSYPYEFQTNYTLGDTIEFNGLKYLKVNSEANWNSATIGALREDPLTKKIYYYDYNKEFILYEFLIKCR